MTTPGRYSGNPKPTPKPKPPRKPAPTTEQAQVRIIAPPHMAEQLLRVMRLAADTMPGWHIRHVSAAMPAEHGHTRRFIELVVRDA